jgi:hypothetical protein
LYYKTLTPDSVVVELIPSPATTGQATTGQATTGTTGQAVAATTGSSGTSLCGQAVTASSSSVTITSLAAWGADSYAQAQFSVAISVQESSLQDWRLLVEFAGGMPEQIVNSGGYQIYDGGAFLCAGSNFVVIGPVGGWVNPAAQGATITIEFTATNVANLSSAQLLADTVVQVYHL